MTARFYSAARAFQEVLTTIEFIVPAVFFRLVIAEEQVSRAPPG